MKFDIWDFLEKSVEKIEVSLKSDKSKGCFTWILFTSMTISRWFLLRMRNVSNESCIENQNTYFMFSDFFPRKSCRLWDSAENVVESDGSQCHNMAHARCMRDKHGYTNAHAHAHASGNNCYANGPQCHVIRVLLFFKGRAVAQAVWRQPLTAEDRIRSPARPCEICCG